jgi:hypothetical protein
VDDIEIRKKAREICRDYPHGIRAGELLKLVGETDYNAVLKELLVIAGQRGHNGCENCGCCDCEF